MAYWKRTLTLALAFVMVTAAAGCSSSDSAEPEVQIADAGNVSTDDAAGEETDEEADEVTDSVEVISDLEAVISWWTYPVFVQDDGEADGMYEQSLIAAFNERYPNITVELTVLDYSSGPDEIQALIDAGGDGLPNVLLDEPGRISGYASDGVLADLGGLFTEDVISDMVSDGILTACTYGDEYVMFPLSGSNYCMAFNLEMLEESGAADLIDLDGDLNWTTETFEQVIELLYDWGLNAGMLYCSGIAGDYATRTFLTNLYDADLMNEELTEYTFDSDAAVETLTKVKEWIDNGWMLNGSGSTGADAVASFVSGENSYCILWSLAQALSNADTLEENGVEVVVLPYPSEDGEPELSYVLNGFCIFDSEDEAVLEASKYFVDFICNNEDVAAEVVVRTGACPVRESLGDVYSGNETAAVFESLMAYSGTYYNKVNGYESMRVYWYQMEASVINGETEAEEAAASFVENANATLETDDE